mmetsp:Transcript_50648/g.68916  ORF Transcript_50648/g.68916 Transcript_50648/m.68916 type:complete len:106 (-) Transcript_50648:101-418(-)
MGDDRTDESMFQCAELAQTTGQWITVKVGSGETLADYNLRTPLAVRRFLRVLLDFDLPSIGDEMPPSQIILEGPTVTAPLAPPPFGPPKPLRLPRIRSRNSLSDL